MNRSRMFAVGTVLALAAAVVIAGEGKCTYSTQECLNYMATKMKNSGWVGVELDKAAGGMEVLKVIPGSPAESAGLQPGDVLVAINGIALSDSEKLMKAKENMKPGSSVTWTIQRNGADRKVSITLAPMPADVLARYVGQHMLEHAAVEVASGGN